MSNGNNKNSSENPVFDQVEKESERQSGYVKLQAGEERTFRFNPDKIELVDNEFNGKKTKRVEYKVTDPDNEDDEGEKRFHDKGFSICESRFAIGEGAQLICGNRLRGRMLRCGR